MRYERLDVWKRSFRLSVNIHQLFADNKNFGFKDQICRSSLSIPSNIAEGLERDTERDKARFIVIAKGSLGELKTQIMIAIEIGYIPVQVGETLSVECEELSRMLGSLIKKIRVNIE